MCPECEALKERVAAMEELLGAIKNYFGPTLPSFLRYQLTALGIGGKDGTE